MSESPHQKDMLLMPEGVIRLKGTGCDIVSLCNGERTFSEILTELEARYPATSREEISSEAIHFLETLREKRVLDF